MIKTWSEILDLKKNLTENLFFKNLRSATTKLSLIRLKWGTSVYVIIVTLKTTKIPIILVLYNLHYNRNKITIFY